MNSAFRSFRPTVPGWGLFFLAATTWGCAGVVLLARGYAFVIGTFPPHVNMAVAGILAGILFFKLMFERVAARHIGRILSLASVPRCLFAFMSWRSYMLMGLMITAGILARQLGVLPPPTLGAVYLAMGIPLLISSFRIFQAGTAFRATAASA